MCGVCFPEGERARARVHVCACARMSVVVPSGGRRGTSNQAAARSATRPPAPRAARTAPGATKNRSTTRGSGRPPHTSAGVMIALEHAMVSNAWARGQGGEGERWDGGTVARACCLEREFVCARSTSFSVHTYLSMHMSMVYECSHYRARCVPKLAILRPWPAGRPVITMHDRTRASIWGRACKPRHLQKKTMASLGEGDGKPRR